MSTVETIIKHAEPMTAQDFLAQFEARKTAIMAREPEGWMIGWEYGLFVQFGDDGKARTTGYENATMFDDPDAARRTPVWNGAQVRGLVMRSDTAQIIALTEIEKAIATCKAIKETV